MINKIAKFVVVFGLFTLSTSWVFAHSTGQSVNQKSGDYLVDIGYDSITPNPVAGEPTLFDLKLFKNSDEVGFSEVIVDIGLKPEPIIFYGSIKTKPEGPNTWIFTFPKSGDYNFRVRYKNEDKTLAEANFSLEVLKAEYEETVVTSGSDKTIYNWMHFGQGASAGILGVALVGGVYALLKKRKITNP